VLARGAEPAAKFFRDPLASETLGGVLVVHGRRVPPHGEHHQPQHVQPVAAQRVSPFQHGSEQQHGVNELEPGYADAAARDGVAVHARAAGAGVGVTITCFFRYWCCAGIS